jgi:hypothetical protein
MTPEQVSLMDTGEPFNSDEFFATAAPISHGKASISIYLARLLIEIGGSGVLQALHYGGSGTSLYGTMMHGRGTDHWIPSVRAGHISKVLYGLWNDSSVKAWQIVAAICSPGDLVLRFGRVPIAVLGKV